MQLASSKLTATLLSFMMGCDALKTRATKVIRLPLALRAAAVGRGPAYLFGSGFVYVVIAILVLTASPAVDCFFCVFVWM